MFRQDLFYPRYSNFGYNKYVQSYNTTYTPYMSYEQICNNENEIKNEATNLNETSTVQNINSKTYDDDAKTDTYTRFGPINFGKDEISLFGLSIAIDDLILGGLIILLLIESENNYALIIVLGLMLFNINLSSLNLF